MKRKRLIIVISPVLLVVLVVLAIKLSGGTDDTYTFETAEATRGTISNTITATGTLEAITTVEVGTQVSGVIEKIYVDFNSVVEEGQLLAELDKTPLLAQLEQSKATVDQAEAELEYQTANYNRLKALFEKKLIAQADFDQAKYDYSRAKASLSSARSDYNKNKINLGYATILSPINGVVLERAVDEGQTVAASFNTPTLFTIAKDLTQMQVESDIDEADIGMVREEQRVEFTVDAYPDDKFAGSVSEVRLQPVITNNVVTYTVIVNAPNPEKKLMPGMTASIIVFIEEEPDALIIPGKALRFSPDQEIMMSFFESLPKDMRPQGMPSGTMPQGASAGDNLPGMMSSGGSGGNPGFTMVWVKEGSNVHPQLIETGINNGSEVEIKSGLEEGDEIILSMSRSTLKDEGEKAEFRSPFMPSPPGRR